MVLQVFPYLLEVQTTNQTTKSTQVILNIYDVSHSDKIHHETRTILNMLFRCPVRLVRVQTWCTRCGLRLLSFFRVWGVRGLGVGSVSGFEGRARVFRDMVSSYLGHVMMGSRHEFLQANDVLHMLGTGIFHAAVEASLRALEV